MKSSSVLIVGCGDLGRRTGLLLQDRGWSVAGARRSVERLPEGFVRHAADYTRPGSLDFLAQARPDFVVATFNPADRSVDGYRAGFSRAMGNLLAGLGEHRPRHILMASSTRVFAESGGGWVDEDSPLGDEDAWAREIIAAERQLLDSPHPASVVRFAGIYGFPGGRLLTRIRRGEICPAQPVSYTNRIHRDDCAGFLAHLLCGASEGHPPAPVYIGADDLPAPRHEVESWLAAQLGVDAPIETAAPGMDPTRHNTGHKRCRNRALKDSGYALIYPDYRAGYGALLEDA